MTESRNRSTNAAPTSLDPMPSKDQTPFMCLCCGSSLFPVASQILGSSCSAHGCSHGQLSDEKNTSKHVLFQLENSVRSSAWISPCPTQSRTLNPGPCAPCSAVRSMQGRTLSAKLCAHQCGSVNSNARHCAQCRAVRPMRGLTFFLQGRTLNAGPSAQCKAVRCCAGPCVRIQGLALNGMPRARMWGCVLDCRAVSLNARP